MTYLFVAAALCLSTAGAQQNPGKQAGAAILPAESGLRTTLPRFEDYPAVIFTGKPAKVNLASHPRAKIFRTRLTEAPEDGTQFAGHYRVVVIGCGSSCQEIWAVDLIDGGVRHLFTASYGVAFRPDSRLIVQPNPELPEEVLKSMSTAEVEDWLKRYGPPRYWLENEGKFERIGPDKMHIDPISKKIVAD